jgi:hypothetical protein
MYDEATVNPTDAVVPGACPDCGTAFRKRYEIDRIDEVI